MRKNRLTYKSEQRMSGEHPQSCGWVSLHDRVLVLGQAARLPQNRVRDPDLSQIMQKTAIGAAAYCEPLAMKVRKPAPGSLPGGRFPAENRRSLQAL